MRVRVRGSTNGIGGSVYEKRQLARVLSGGKPLGPLCERFPKDQRFGAESGGSRVVAAQAAAVTTLQEVKSAASAKVTVKTRLCIQHQVAFGSSLKVVGAGPEFGEWQSEKAVVLQWNEGHIWSVDLDLEPGSYEFKCVTAAGDHISAWEDGTNRILQVPNGVRGIRVDGSWGRTAENRITVTEPLAAASVAARQKRAAAARLLTKALAEVSAAAAASPPSAAVLEGRKAAASVKRPDGSKAAAAAELEREAKETLRELGELLSSDSGIESSLSLTRVRKADKAGAEADSKASSSKSSSTAASEAKPEEAAASSSGNSSGSSSGSVKASKGASWRELLSEEPKQGEKQQDKAKPTEVQAASALEAKGEPASKQVEPAVKPASAAAAAAGAEASSPKAAAEQEVPDRWAFVKSAAASRAAAPAAESKPAASNAAKADAAKADAAKADAVKADAAKADAAKADAVKADAVKADAAKAEAAKAEAAKAEAAKAEAAKADAAKSSVKTEPAKPVKSEAPAAAAKEQPGVAKPAAQEVAAIKPAAPAAEARAPEKPTAETKAEKQPEGTKAPESSSGVSRFGGLLAKLGGSLGLSQQPSPEESKSIKVEAAPASSGTASAQASPSSSTGTSPASSGASASTSTSTSTSSGARKFSWRSLGDEADEGKKQEQQKEEPAVEVKPAVPAAAASDAKQPAQEEEDTASRFERLLKAKQGKASGSSSAVAAPEATKEEKKPEPAVVAEPVKKEDQKKEDKVVVEAKQQQDKADKAAAAPEPKEQKPEVSGTTAAAPDAAAMGANNSKQVETVQDEGLDRLLKVWDSTWSKGKKDAGAAPAENAAADAPSTSTAAAAPPPATGSGGGRRRWAELDADDGPSTSAASSSKPAKQQQPQPQRQGISAALGPASAAAAKTANGGTPPIGSGSGGAGGSSSESLFSIAERLTSNAPAATPTAVPDDASPDVTMRKGALAAMQVDRQGSYDNRSSYLSQSLLQESLAGGNGGAAGAAEGPSSNTLLQKLRAANAARGAGGSAANGASANGGAANGTFVPPLPATPAPPGILSSNDDEDGEMVPPLPATPPPPSYLTGPAGGKGAPVGDVGPVVPPLPATPVASSVLGGADSAGSEKGRGGGSAEDMLRRAHDADKVLAMLRGNLPLTPIARGGRGGAGAGPLSMADAEEGEDDDDDGSVGHSRKPVEPHPQADPVAATQRAIADAVSAWDKTRAALAALQQSAAELGLSPGAIQDQAAKLLQNMPRAIGTDGTNAGAGAGAAANGQPNAIPMTAQLGNLMSGLGLSASSIAEQLTRKSLDGSEQGGGGSGLGLISGLLGGLTGNTPLPPGCVRLVAGAHMIPHVDKVDKGGEDAYFISRVGLGGVGVADGVSGWADEGIDPAEYPRTLMRYATDAYEAARGTLSAQDIIRYAQYRTYLKGSSTVCLALMKPNKQLEIANVGDSGVRILRNGRVIFGTEAQQHAFNMPFQLSHPNNVEDPDSADDADVHLVEVQDGDVIMLATDGLFDNVFDDEIEQIVSHQLRELAAQGRGKAPSAPMSLMSIGSGPPLPEPVASTSAATNGSSSTAAGSGGSGAAAPGAAGSTGAARPRGAGLLSQSLNAAAAGAGSKPGAYRPEDAARVARALAERAHLHARNPTQRTPWSVTSSQQPNFMWAKFFAKGGGKMDDCTVLVAFVCGE